MPTTVLQTQNLTKRYGDLSAVNNLNLEVYQGEVFGFLGPNGAGKTTAISMMCGLLKPDAGTVSIRGRDVTGSNAETRKRVGMCPQEIVLWERLTCREQLIFMARMYNVPANIAQQQADHLLAALDLTAKRDKQARTLSGGMQRRLNLAMALVHDPEIVVLDEPEAGLDPQSRIKVREYIQSLARHKTVILTTHNIDEADRLADRVAIIDHGELLVLDTPQALKQQLQGGSAIEIGLKSAFDPAAETRLQEALRPLTGQTHLDPDRRRLMVRAGNGVSGLPAILSRLEAAGASVGEVRIRENTLEDVFIQLTGRRLRE
ncbi:MAG: ABC transporter ATP-binding protein [Chloroflexota bacterium]